jgi:hypothetical protein
MLKVRLFRAACVLILRHAPDDYAKAYAQRALQDDTLEHIKSMVPYLLSNLRYWRGIQARQVKDILRKI